MAVLQSNRKRKLKLQDLNSFITCEICRGYLIKPTTITECLHTFCRSCIVKYLQDSDDNNCPICSSQIHETNPFDLLRSDKTLEDIIYKLVPKLQESEQRREREFLEQLNFENEKKSKEAEETKENGSDSATEPANKRKKQHATEGNYHRDDPQIGVCLECLIDDSVQAEHPVRELERKYIRCSSRLTIAQVKKFLKVKLNLKTADQVEVMCNGEIMGKDHTLEFVYMTRWRVKASDRILVLMVMVNTSPNPSSSLWIPQPLKILRGLPVAFNVPVFAENERFHQLLFSNDRVKERSMKCKLRE